jgi:hypothetical protein
LRKNKLEENAKNEEGRRKVFDYFLEEKLRKKKTISDGQELDIFR